MTTRTNIVLLGATGSIGVNTLDVIRRFPDLFNVVGLAGGGNVELLARQIIEFRPRTVAVLNSELARRLRDMLPGSVDAQVLYGPEGYETAAALDEAAIMVSAVVGAAGLRPTLAAVRAGRRIALANKETLVTAGRLVMAEAEKSGAEILPVDSEHSAIFQSLSGRPEEVARLVLTASGGPFWNLDADELQSVTREQALNHPNWNMGAKISVDSATLMNKGLEAIEARWLFGLDFDRISIMIHRQSIVHSLVEYVDGSMLAQMGEPDMRVPIAYALSHPRRLPLDLPGLDLTAAPPLTFEPPDTARFPCLGLALEAGRAGGSAPARLNAANEVAVQAFLDGRLAYSGVARVVEEVLARGGGGPADSLDDIMAADADARRRALEIIDQAGDMQK